MKTKNLECQAEQCQAAHKCCRLKLHGCYIISGLILAIIILLTVDLGGIESLTSYLNFSMGVSSCILAVVAIVYSFTTQAANAADIQSLHQAAATVERTAKIAEEKISGLTQTLENFNQGMLNPDAPKAQLQVDNEKSSNVEIKPPSSIATEPAQPSSPTPAPAPAPPAPTNNEQPPTVGTPAHQAVVEQVIEKATEIFAARSSINGMKAMYLLCRAAVLTQSTNLKTWSSLDQGCSYDYAYGFIIAMASVGFFQIEDDQQGNVRASGFTKGFTQRVFTEVNQRSAKSADFAKQIGIIDRLLGA